MLARCSDECQRLRLARARVAHERSFLGRRLVASVSDSRNVVVGTLHGENGVCDALTHPQRHRGRPHTGAHGP